jgi:hypothetical protein
MANLLPILRRSGAALFQASQDSRESSRTYRSVVLETGGSVGSNGQSVIHNARAKLLSASDHGGPVRGRETTCRTLFEIAPPQTNR